MRYKVATSGPKAMYKLGVNLIYQIYKYSANILTSVQIHNSTFFMSTSHMKHNYTQMCTNQIYFTFFYRHFIAECNYSYLKTKMQKQTLFHKFYSTGITVLS